MHPSKQFSTLRLAAAACAAALALALPGVTLARDLTLGVHYTSEDDKTDTVYVSADGETFYGVSQPYVDNDPYTEPNIAYDSTTSLHCCHMDPSIVYWDGYFWMASADNRYDGKCWPMISYSKDLITWTHPEGGIMFNEGSTLGVEVDELPTVDGASYYNFDVVTPKFYVIDGQLYLTFCAGYFGLFHGNQFHDQMQCYVARVEQLSASDGTPADNGHLWPNNMTFKCDTAHKVAATDYDHADYIDSNFAWDQITGEVYLTVKQGGLTEQILRSNNPADPADGSAYQVLNARASWGYEGVSFNYANGAWHLYGDGVVGTKARGMRSVTGANMDVLGEWRDAQSVGDDPLHDLTFLDPSGNPITAMHGQEITISEDSPAYPIVLQRLAEVSPQTAATVEAENATS